MFYTSSGIMSFCESMLFIKAIITLLAEGVISAPLKKQNIVFLHSVCTGLTVICALSQSVLVKITEHQSLQMQCCITISILAMLLSENVWPREVSASNSTIQLKIIACTDL